MGRIVFRSTMLRGSGPGGRLARNVDEPRAELGRRTHHPACDLNIREVELSTHRRAGSSGHMNDDLGSGGGANQVVHGEAAVDDVDAAGHTVMTPGPHDGPNHPSSVTEVTDDVLTDEPVGAGHGDQAAHVMDTFLPAPAATARLTR